MKIQKVLNNNLVLVRGDDGKEQILKGKGIGFGRKKGDVIDEKIAERVFSPNDMNESNRFQTFFRTLDPVYWEITEDLIAYATHEGELRFHDNMMLSLCDHIYGAVERYQNGLVLKNPMLWEIKRLYPKEFQVGLHAIGVIEQRLEIHMDEDEAAFLAFHFVCAQLENANPGDVNAITDMIGSIIDIIEDCYQVKLDESGWDYQRFVTHLKFLAHRISQNKQYEDSDDEWFKLLKSQYPSAYNCIVKVADYIYQKYHYDMNREEMLYLMIHIEKVTRDCIRLS